MVFINHPTIAISACLLGENVRYDGKNKRHPQIADYLAKELRLLPFCPEMAIGLGVPRKKIHLYIKENHIDLLRCDDHRHSLSAKIAQYAKSFLQKYPALKYVIAKSKSPSCAILSAPVIPLSLQTSEGGGKMAENVDTVRIYMHGMFIQEMLKINPALEIMDETQLMTPMQCDQLIARVRRNCFEDK